MLTRMLASVLRESDLGRWTGPHSRALCENPQNRRRSPDYITAQEQCQQAEDLNETCVSIGIEDDVEI